MNQSEHTFDHVIGMSLKRLRAEKALTLDGLADVSGVSRAMISRIERGEVSPSASLLAKLCAALGTSLSAFFAEADKVPDPLLRGVDQRCWRDPDIGYVRTAVSPQGLDSAVDIVSVRFPAGARIAFPSEPSAKGTWQYIWLFDGFLDVEINETAYRLEKGDCLFMAVADPHTFFNASDEDAHYAVIIERGR